MSRWHEAGPSPRCPGRPGATLAGAGPGDLLASVPWSQTGDNHPADVANIHASDILGIGHSGLGRVRAFADGLAPSPVRPIMGMIY